MNKQFAHIHELRQELMALGYHPYQINTIIMDAIATNQLDHITPEQTCKLTAALEEYVRFARRSREFSG